ncbi:hypothetical protein K1T71_002367 [Dendrolimus kikuchii]|uniref:Uncharacterized protein n=1 Tax=Dendrolimus kikuchii TaxID=765133 RepID=A0ACC1DCU7_9NEOP|nr:hypothetical protein K1T71_002367 [Dendrolimus kikuchii]
MFKNTLIQTCFFLLFQSASTSDSCGKHSTCHECIKDANSCVWCGASDFNGPRCKQEDSFIADWCPKDLQNPKSFLDTNIPDNRNFSALDDNVVQMKPQKYKLYLRPGRAVNFTFSFQVAEDYPVDMYFLLDTSISMHEFNKMAADKTSEIYMTMKNMTKNVNLGYGTFIDKNALPFTDIINSTQTYSFQHHFKLSNETEKFKESISNAPSGYNRDLPEGGLDALAQTMVCKDVVGWRDQSTKIIILTTDASYHVAGDGRNAGIFEPFDGLCHTVNGRYTKETEMDYPTIGMIKKLAVTNEIIVIFFVEEEVQAVYRDLSNVVSGWKYKTYDKSLNTDISELFVSTLKGIYEQITKQVKLKLNVRKGLKKHIHINFDPDCNKKTCEVRKGEQTDFTGTILLTEYDGNDNLIIDIGIEGISDKLTLDVDVIKDCDCEKEEKRTEYCSNEIQQCGICICGEKRYGDRCICEYNSLNSFKNESTCLAKGIDDLCSGAGSCICGTCVCSKGYNGDYCQCNENSCPIGPGGQCNGHGMCNCGKCVCNAPWSGNTCDCFQSTIDCIDPDGRICSGRGACACNRCVCPDIAKWDGRNTQDESTCKVEPCPDCVSRQCDLLSHCVLCDFGYKLECSDCYNAIERNITESLKSYINTTEWMDCPEIRITVGCYAHYMFKYKEDVYGILVQILEKQDCTGGYYIYGGASLILLVLVGLGTLITWKVLTEAHYKAEYEKFLKDHKDDLGDLCENPVYTPAVTKVDNPTFRKLSFRK